MRRLLVLALSIVAAQPVAAQSSIFGIRGLGYPGRGISPRAWAMGGSTGLLDGESGQNPASIGGLTTMAASFLVAPQFRSTETPAGTASPRETQFPF